MNFRATPPPVKPFGFMAMPEQTVETLDNGIVFHRYIGGDQLVCRLTLHIPGGQCESGILRARAVAAMLTESTTGYDAEALAEAIDFNGARMGASAHAHHIVLDVALTTARLPHILPVVEEVLQRPSFEPARLEVIKLKLKNQLRHVRMDLASSADEAFQPLICGAAHPLAQIVKEEDVDALDAEALEKVYRSAFAPAGVHAYLCGRLENSAVEAVRHFLTLLQPLGEGLPFKLIRYAAQAAGIRVERPFADSQQCAIVTGMPAVDRSHPDYVPLRYTVMALGGYFGSRLMTGIREEKGLTYGIGASLLGSYEGGLTQISTTTDRSYAARVEAEIDAELTRLVADPPQGEELERLSRYAATSLAELLDNPMSIMGYYASINLIGAPSDYFAEQQRTLAALTPDTISAMASRYLLPASRRTATVGLKG